MMPTCEDILVYEGGSTTNDLPKTVVASLGLPEIASQPEEATQSYGTVFLAARGAEIIGAVDIA